MDIGQENISVKAYTGNYEIIGNGLGPATKEMRLSLKVSNLEIEFEFISDKNKEPKIEKRVVDNKLYIVCINFSSNLGTGMVAPFSIGNLNGRELLLSYYVWSPNSDDDKRLINWTVLLGQEINNEEA